jgi:hypothetical protein
MGRVQRYRVRGFGQVASIHMCLAPECGKYWFGICTCLSQSCLAVYKVFLRVTMICLYVC